MFTKQPSSNLQSSQSHNNIERLHAGELEPVPTHEPPTLINGSVIGSDLTILGENINIVSTQALQIDGEIRGDVSGKKINIGIGGLVVGTISAQTVEIDGGVQGTVRADEVRLNADAKVSGELLHQTLVISEGAEFEGSVRRSHDQVDLKPDLEAARSRPLEKPEPVDPAIGPHVDAGSFDADETQAIHPVQD